MKPVPSWLQALVGSAFIMFIYLFKQGRQISRAMQDANDFNSMFQRTIKDDVLSDNQTPQTGRQLFALTPDFRPGRQLRKLGNDELDEFVRRYHIVLRDAKPDVIQVRPRRR